ncbi:hypothetical protein MRX96_015891 [Rhipicephalus microplus]
MRRTELVRCAGSTSKPVIAQRTMSSSYSLIGDGARDAAELSSSDDERRSSSDECRFGLTTFSITPEPRPDIGDASPWWRPVELCATAVTRLQQLGSCHNSDGSPVPLVRDEFEATETSDGLQLSVSYFDV